MTSIVVLVALWFAIGCTGGDGDPEVRGYVAAVTAVDGATARLVGGDPPSGDGPRVVVTTNASVIPGGTTRVRLDADRAFATAIVGIEGIDGYYELTLPSAVTRAEVLVTLSQDLAVPAFAWAMSVGGPLAVTPAQVVEVGTGDVQVNLSWNTQADVDLHVIDPAGEEVYWLNRVAASGGELDLDSNAGCSVDDVRNENVTWPTGGAPAGTYRVLVDYWDSCGAAATDYTVTVNVAGRAPLTFSGTFTGAGDRGGPGAGVPITTFSTGAGARMTRHAHALGTFQIESRSGATAYAK